MDLNTTLVSIGGSAGAVAAVSVVARGAWRSARRIVRIAEAVEELTPNSGHSIKDTIGRIDERLDGMDDQLAALIVRFDDHLQTHER